MKKPSLSGLILGILLLATVCVTYASTIWVGQYLTVNNTTYDSPTNSIVTESIPLGNYTVYSTSNLLSGSNCSVFIDLSLDGINFTNAASFPVPSTAGGNTWFPGAVSMSVYQRVRITNNTADSLAIIQN